MIAALPTDPAVLNHPEYKARGYDKGGKAVVVRVIIETPRFERVVS